MSSQSFPYPLPVKHISVSDSLKNSLHVMQVKLDSLEKVVIKTEIGTGFFSDVISTNLYTFATIISLTALISWGFIGRMLAMHKKAVEAASIKIVRDHAEKYDTSLNEIREKLLQTIFDASTSMYLSSLDAGSETSRFRWAILTLSAYLDIKGGTLKLRKTIAGLAVKHLNKLSVGDKTVKTHVKTYLDTLDKLDLIKDKELTALSKNMREDILHICHAKPQVEPDNLMEDKQNK